MNGTTGVALTGAMSVITVLVFIGAAGWPWHSGPDRNGARTGTQPDRNGLPKRTRHPSPVHGPMVRDLLGPVRVARGGPITDPDHAEALGLTADAARLQMPIHVETGPADVWGKPMLREWYCAPPPPRTAFALTDVTWLDEADPETVTVEQIHRIRLLPDNPPPGGSGTGPRSSPFQP